MQMFLAMLFAGMSCALVLLIPIALPRRSEPVSVRDQAWRDELPLFLRVLRAPLQLYAPAVESSLSPHRREVIQSQLNAAGAAYLVSPAEFVILRRLAVVAGIVIATIAAFIGAGGYGERIVTGLALNDNAMLLAGAIPAAALALLVQGAFELADRCLVPAGLRAWRQT